MELARQQPFETEGLLFPMMLIAAIAVIVFSIAGIATVTGWMPNALVGDATLQSGSGIAANSTDAVPEGQGTGPMFQCVECGVIDSVREIERRSSASGSPLARVAPGATVGRRGPSL
jgi:outer membrane lipoprotein SlyB